MASAPRFSKRGTSRRQPRERRWRWRNARTEPPHPVDQLLPPGKLMASGLQHVAASYAGVVAPPLVLGAAVGLSPRDLTFLVSAALFTAGIATLLQTLGFWRVGARMPFVNGVSFAGVAPMIAIVDAQDDRAHALPVVFGGVLVAGALGFLLAPYFCRLVRFFPPIVSGTVITLIGITLLPVSFGWIQGGHPERPTPMTNLALAAATLVIVLVLRRVLRGFFQQIAILLGLVAGTLIAIPAGAVDFAATRQAGLVGFPTPFHFGGPEFQLSAIISMCILMLVCMTESTADMLALGVIVGRPADERTIAAGLRADTLSSAVSPLFNGFANSAFAQNIGLVAITRVRSRFTVAACGVMFIVLGLSPVFASLIAVVPQPVLGGAGIVLFGTVAAGGVNVLLGAGLEKADNLLIVATSLGMGMIPVISRTFYDNAAIPESLKIILDSGVSAGCFTAVVLNLVFNHFGRRRGEGEGAAGAAGAVEPSVPVTG
ncbi:nucleobase:cation symporter-2 family protein [Streptomyces sp. NPDC057654]|uniref:nucleobase:cation symporter-2 family protein n=1 Tax=Streptomyces sp. NPDC057654 TaxID=3346196 RepID=UPI0036B87503